MAPVPRRCIFFYFLGNITLYEVRGMIKNTKLEQIKDNLCEIFADCGDFNIRPIITSNQTLYLANLGAFSGRDYISENVIKPIVASDSPITDNNTLLGIICTSEVKEADSLDAVKTFILGGFAVVLAQIGIDVSAFACMARNDPGRSVSEPQGEIVVRGPREGFTEKAEDSAALIRKRLRTENLKIINLSLGEYSQTTVKVLYVKDVADKKLVDDIVERIKHMKLPTVMDSGYVEQFLTSGKPRLFTEIGNSEKPDKVAAKLAEGRVAIICDGSPVVLTVPYLFVESLQSAEDYLKTPYYATFIRFIRFICLLISLYLPAFYIAIMEHHKNAVAHSLFESMMDARKDIPFSLFGELVVILLIFELIREVGVRMPGSVGSAVSIVGGLILGDAAISAGISSAPVIMVASLTAISTFILPPYMNSTVLVRFINIFAARMFGLVGIAVTVTFTLVHLCGKNSFGVPYMSPFSPANINMFRDALVINPKKALTDSPEELKTKEE